MKKKKNKEMRKKLTKEEQRRQDAFVTWRFIITFVVLFSAVIAAMIFGPKL